MIIRLRWKDRKLNITLPYRNFDGQWKWGYVYSKPYSTYHTTKLINPWYSFKGWVNYKLDMFYLWRTNQQYKQCHGCGTGIAKWKIKDPNKKRNTTKYWNVCDGCCRFYDRHWSAKKIIGWKDGKAYVNKRSKNIR